MLSFKFILITKVLYLPFGANTLNKPEQNLYLTYLAHFKKSNTMNKLTKITCGLTIIIGLLSFSLADKKINEFSYPKREKTTINLKAGGFKEFKKEWRGADYYYYGESSDGIICSVLYFKLNEKEQHSYVDKFGGTTGAGIPFAYFSENSNLKNYEKNIENWGTMTDDFMFKQSNITDFSGVKLKQKHMYAYSMFDKDMFVNIHLSKTNYNPADSTTMREILNSLTKRK